MSIEIALKPATGKTLPGNIQAIIQNEYASRYLEGIGANPSKENIDLMLKSLPLKEALLLPVWQREAIVIIPGIAKNADITSIMSTMVSSADINEKRSSSPEHTRKKPNPIVTKPKTSEKNQNLFAKKNVSFTPTLSSPKKETAYKKSRRLSWCTVNTLDILDPILDHIGIDEARTKHFRNLLLPMGSIEDNIFNAVRSFNHSLDGFILDTGVNNVGALYRSIKLMLLSSACNKLFDAMSRFCYWNIIHPTARKVLVAAKQVDPGAFPDHIPTTAAAKLESIAYLFSEKNAKKRKEEEKKAEEEKQKQEGSDNREGRSDSVSSNVELENGVESTLVVVTGEEIEKVKEEEGEGEGAKTVERTAENDAAAAALTGLGLDTEQSEMLDDGEEHNNICAITSSLDDDQEAGHNLSFISSTATDTSLDIKEREMIFLQLEQCVHNIHREMDTCEISVSTAMQALVSCTHYVVDEILTELYPWFKIQGKKKTSFESMHLTSNHSAITVKEEAGQPKSRYNHPHFNDFESKPEDSIHKLRLQMRRLMHQALSDVIDPSRLFTSTLINKSCVRTPLSKDPVHTHRTNTKRPGVNSMETTKISSSNAGAAVVTAHELQDVPFAALKKTQPVKQSRYYTTSIGIRALYEHEASSPSTRRLLGLSTTTPYVTIPGLTNPRYDVGDSNGDGGTTGLNGCIGNESVLTDDMTAGQYMHMHDGGVDAVPSRAATANSAADGGKIGIERQSSQSYQCAYRTREINTSITSIKPSLGFGGGNDNNKNNKYSNSSSSKNRNHAGTKPKTAGASIGIGGGRRSDMLRRDFSASSLADGYTITATGIVSNNSRQRQGQRQGHTAPCTLTPTRGISSSAASSPRFPNTNSNNNARSRTASYNTADAGNGASSAQGFSSLFHHSSFVQVDESGMKSPKVQSKPEFAVGSIDSVVELALPCPYYETKEHNRFTRNIDAADIALREYQEEQARLAAATSSVRRPKLTKKQSARLLSGGSGANSPAGAFTPGGFNSCSEDVGGVDEFRPRAHSIARSLCGSVDSTAPTTPRLSNPGVITGLGTSAVAGIPLGQMSEASEFVTSPISAAATVVRVQPHYPLMKESEEGQLSNTFYFEKPPPVVVKDDPTSKRQEARRLQLLQKNIAKQAQERRGDPVTPAWKLNYVPPSVDTTQSSFTKIAHPLPAVVPQPHQQQKSAKLNELEVIPLSNEGRNKLLRIAIDRTGMQYSKRHIARHSRTKDVLSRLALLKNKEK